MNPEKTLVLIKPDGVQRGLIGEIIARFERKGLKTSRTEITQTSKRPSRSTLRVPSGEVFL